MYPRDRGFLRLLLNRANVSIAELGPAVHAGRRTQLRPRDRGLCPVSFRPIGLTKAIRGLPFSYRASTSA